MATIENLGAAFIRRVVRSATRDLTIPLKKVRDAGAKSADAKIIKAELKVSDELKRRRESSIGRGREPENVEQKRMSLDELAELLRKINLTFDLFEVQTKFIINRESGQISVEVVNQRTGEVIRKIPPYEVASVRDALLNAEPLVTDVKA